MGFSLFRRAGFAAGWGIAGIVALLVVGIGVGVGPAAPHQNRSQILFGESRAAAAEPTPPEKVMGKNPPRRVANAKGPDRETLRIVFAGDVMLDGGPGHAIVHGEDPFADFAEILDQGDLAVCNLECVIGWGGKLQHKNYTFRGHEKGIPLLKKHFDAVSVANNHAGDFGPESLANQCELLTKAGLSYFGGGRNRREARKPLLFERKGTKILLLGYDAFPPKSFEATDDRAGVAWLHEEESLAEIAALRKEHPEGVILPYLHWGREMHSEPRPWQKKLARQMIDAGASAVIGAHPHVTQTIDVYRGKPIVYSLGNFVFDYFPVDPEVWTGWVVRFDFRPDGGVDFETFACELDRTGIPRLTEAVTEE